MASKQQKIPNAILLIEESETFRLLYRTILKALGVAKVVEAVDGIGGYREFVMGQFDIVIMAYRLPRKSGLETLREIRATRRDARIIMLTTENDKKTVLECIKAGVRYYIQKDLSARELKTKLKEVFNLIL